MLPTNHVATRWLLTALVVLTVGVLAVDITLAGVPAAFVDHAQRSWQEVKNLWHP